MCAAESSGLSTCFLSPDIRYLSAILLARFLGTPNRLSLFFGLTGELRVQAAQHDTDVETTLELDEDPPEGEPIPEGAERPEEFSPGLTPELMELVEAAAKM